MGWRSGPLSTIVRRMKITLMLGSAPNALDARDWPREAFDSLLAINNAHRVRPDWDYWIHPWDFPDDRRPVVRPGQVVVTEDDFVPTQNQFGGFVYAGGTMAYTAAYWALATLKPTVLAVMGCDMHYEPTGNTHFYGKGSADPLRDDITLRSLEAKATRLEVMAARQGTAVVNLSHGPSRLTFPRVGLAELPDCAPRTPDDAVVEAALKREAALGYLVPSGRYWEDLSRFDPTEIDALDALWLTALPPEN